MQTVITPFVLALALAAPPAGDCSDCVPGKRKAELCGPHAAAEKEGVKACTSGLRSKDPDERIMALLDLAVLTDDHANAPSPMIVKTLARGLKDDAIEVRLETVKLLGSQHPEAALEALASFVKPHMKLTQEVDEEYEEIRFEREKRRLKTDEENWSKKMRADDAKDREEQERLGTQRDALGELTATLATALARFPDDRAVEALGDIAEVHARAEVLEALATLGSREAAEIVYAQLELTASLWAPLQETADELKRLADEVGSADTTEIDQLLDTAKALGVQVAHARVALETMARAAGHETGLPPDSFQIAEHWARWLEKHGDSLPKSLGRMAMPWDD